MSFFRRLLGGRKANGPDSVYGTMRGNMLALPPEATGADPAVDEVYGVLVDMGTSGGQATLVSLVDGTTSLYTSTGGGVIGGQQHESCAAASKNLIDQANLTRSLLSANWTDGPLAPGYVRFIALTPSGTLAAEAPESELAALSDPLSPLFCKSHEVITALRVASGG